MNNRQRKKNVTERIKRLTKMSNKIEQLLKSDYIDGLDPPLELYNKIVTQLKEKGIWKDDGPSD